MPSETAKDAARNAGLSGAEGRAVGVAIDRAYAPFFAAARCCVNAINEVHANSKSSTNWINLITART